MFKRLLRQLANKLRRYSRGRAVAKKYSNDFMSIMMYHDQDNRQENATTLEYTLRGRVDSLEYSPPITAMVLTAIIKTVSMVLTLLAFACIAEVICFVIYFYVIGVYPRVSELTAFAALGALAVFITLVDHVCDVVHDEKYTSSGNCICAVADQIRIGCLAKVRRHQDVQIRKLPIDELRKLSDALSEDTDSILTTSETALWRVVLSVLAAAMIAVLAELMATTAIACSTLNGIVRIPYHAHAILAVIAFVCVFAQAFAIMVNWHKKPLFGVAAVSRFYRWRDERCKNRVERLIEKRANNPAPRQKYFKCH